MNREKRIFTEIPLSVRQDQESENRYLQGYAAVFNQRSKLIGENGKVFYEVIESGAFDEVLQRSDLNVKLTVNHDKASLLARTKSKTLELLTDEKGLIYRALVPNTQLGNDVFTMVERGDFYESSFVFGVKPKSTRWEYDKSLKLMVRYVERIDVLEDVSIVTDGAYANTDISVAQRQLQEIENQSSSYEAERMKLQILKLK